MKRKWLSLVSLLFSGLLLTSCGEADAYAETEVVMLTAVSSASSVSSISSAEEIETTVIRTDSEKEMASLHLKQVIQHSAEVAEFLKSAGEILTKMEEIRTQIPEVADTFSTSGEAEAALEQLRAVKEDALLEMLSDAQSRLSATHLETIAAVEYAEFTASNAGSKMTLAQSLAAAAREDLLELEELLLDADHITEEIHTALKKVEQQIAETEMALEELQKAEAEIPEPETGGSYERYTKAESKLLSLLNGYRSQQGIGSVSGKSALDECAAIRCREMLDKDVFSHTRPNGSDWSTVLWEQGVSAKAWGEIQYRIRGGNAIETQSELAERAMKAWKKSAAHNAIMKSGTYDKVGIAAYQDDDTWIVNAIFTK